MQVFAVMADFLTQNPQDVIVLGLSNIECGDVPTARTQLLGLLAQSPLYKYLATQVKRTCECYLGLTVFESIAWSGACMCSGFQQHSCAPI